MILALLLGCTAGVAPGDYAGEPLFTVSGLVVADVGDLDDDITYGVSLMWAGGQDVGGIDGFLDTSFPAQYTLDLYTPPPDDTPAIVEVDGVRVRAAVVFLYKDDDQDGVWTKRVEAFAGYSSPFVLTWQEEEWPSQDRDLIVPPGYFGMILADTSCLGEADVAAWDQFNIQVAPSGPPPDLNCDGSGSEWEGLGG